MIRLVLDVKQPAVNGCHGGSESVRPPTVVAFKLCNNLDDAVVRGSRLNNLHTWDLVCSVERYGNLGFGLFGDFWPCNESVLHGMTGTREAGVKDDKWWTRV